MLNSKRQKSTLVKQISQSDKEFELQTHFSKLNIDYQKMLKVEKIHFKIESSNSTNKIDDENIRLIKYFSRILPLYLYKYIEDKNIDILVKLDEKSNTFSIKICDVIIPLVSLYNDIDDVGCLVDTLENVEQKFNKQKKTIEIFRSREDNTHNTIFKITSCEKLNVSTNIDH